MRRAPGPRRSAHARGYRAGFPESRALSMPHRGSGTAPPTWHPCRRMRTGSRPDRMIRRRGGQPPQERIATPEVARGQSWQCCSLNNSTLATRLAWCVWAVRLPWLAAKPCRAAALGGTACGSVRGQHRSHHFRGVLAAACPGGFAAIGAAYGIAHESSSREMVGYRVAAALRAAILPRTTSMSSDLIWLIRFSSTTGGIAPAWL